MSGVSKLSADRHQRILLDLVSKPGNDICADCKARAPRWASHNLGIFLCMNCASIHRKIGTHITKVKSLTMDSWSREQVEIMKSIGNIVSNEKFNPNEARNPPPANREESERDSELEKFIRRKYEFKRFTEKAATPSPSVQAPSTRAHSTPATSIPQRSSPASSVPPAQIPHKPTLSNKSVTRFDSASPSIVPSSPHPRLPVASPPAFQSASPSTMSPLSSPPSIHPVWDDIMTLTNPRTSSTPQIHQSSPSPIVSSSPYPTLSPMNHFQTMLENRVPGYSSTVPAPSVPASFQSQTLQSTLANPFGISQPTVFANHIIGTPFQQTSMPAQSQLSQAPFTESSPSSFFQLTPTLFSHQHNPQLSFPQQCFQQQQYPQSLSHMQIQSQPTQGGFGAPVQWMQQTIIPEQQQVRTPEQRAELTDQQKYGQWENQ